MEKKTGLFSRIIGHALIIINICSVLWLGCCLLASYASPARFVYLGIASLTTPFAIIVNIAFVLLWLVTRKKIRSFLSAISLALCYKLIITVFAFNYSAEQDMIVRTGNLKVMHWNVHGMGLYNKRHAGQKTDRNMILETIQAEGPDVLVMPEYYMYRDSSSKMNEQKIMELGAFKEYHFGVDNALGHKVVLGTIFFSKYPVSNYKEVDLGNWILLQHADVHVNGKTIRMFFLHLFSFNINDDERAYLHEVRERTADVMDFDRTEPFIWKFNHSFAIRAGQAEKIAAAIAASPYPVIVCGDFNDLPASYTYTIIRGKLNDAFLDKGFGFGRTYNQILPTLRIDHMLYDAAALKVVGYISPTVYASDHNPVITNFELLR